MAEKPKYGSEYERLVLTQPHPKKATFHKLDDPPYISESRLPSWLAIRMEELVVVAFLLSVFVLMEAARSCFVSLQDWSVRFTLPATEPNAPWSR